jgi:hypothetical protein
MVYIRASAWIDSIRLVENVEENDFKKISNRIECTGSDSEKSGIIMVILLTTPDYTDH